MIREDYINIHKIMNNIKDILIRSEEDIIGCGKYFKVEDRYCGHRYNWKSLKKFKMDLWLCKNCEKKVKKK
jgi:NAD-dependent SIR2 family protein deacetylase